MYVLLVMHINIPTGRPLHNSITDSMYVLKHFSNSLCSLSCLEIFCMYGILSLRVLLYLSKTVLLFSLADNNMGRHFSKTSVWQMKDGVNRKARE